MFLIGKENERIETEDYTFISYFSSITSQFVSLIVTQDSAENKLQSLVIFDDTNYCDKLHLSISSTVIYQVLFLVDVN